MENKFEDELMKIEKLLNKVDEDLKVDNPKEDYNLFFKNVDKTFEIYNICLEELCGQLYLLELSSHSKVYRKLYHHYKHQLYNIMKFQLSLQKDLNDKLEDEKSYKSKIDILMNKVKNLKDKKSNLDNIVEEQKMKIEKLIIQNNEQNKKQQMKQKQLQKRKTEQDFKFYSTSKTAELDQAMQSDEFSYENNYQEILNQVEEIQNDDSSMNPKLKNNLQKLLQDIENQKKKYQDIKNQQNILEKYSSMVQFDNQMQTSFVVYTQEQYQYILNQMENQKEEFEKEKQLFKAQKAQDASEIEENQRQLKQLQFKLDQFTQQVQKLEQQNNQYQIDIDNYQDQQQSLEQEISNLQENIQNENQQKQMLKKQVTQLEDINNTFQQEIETIAQKEQQIDRKEEEIRHLYSQNTEFQQRLQQLEDMELNRDVKLEKDVEILIDNKNKKIEMYENELNKIIKEKKKHELHIEEIENQKNEIQENFQNLSENYQNQSKIIAQLKEKLNQQKPQKQSIIKRDKPSANNRDKVQKKQVKNDQKVQVKQKVKISTMKNLQKQNQKMLKVKIAKEKAIKSSSRIVNKDQSIEKIKEEKPITKQYPIEVQQQNEIQQQSSQQYNSQSQGTIFEEKISSKKVESQSNNAITQSKSQSKYTSNEDMDSQSNSEYVDESSQKLTSEEKKDQNSIKNDSFKKFMQQDQTQEDQLQGEQNRHQKEVVIPPVSITCNRGIITDYSSPIQFIIDQEDVVFCRETDFEKIKSCIDILARIIGYENFEDLNGAGNKDNLDQDNKALLKKAFSGKDNANKILPRFQNNMQQQQKKSKLELKRDSKLEDQSCSSLDKSKGESEYDMDKFEQELSKKPNVYIPGNIKQKKPTKNTKLQRNYYQEKQEQYQGQNEKNYEQDYIVERKKIIQNDNNQEQIEVVEYIRIPKELTVKRSVLNPIFMKSKMKKIRTFEERLLNEFERNQREKEKIYFQMYLNIKNRYRFKPETLIKVYKLYFNKVPDFQKNLTEDYDPEKFLFNFEEFKTEFKQLIQVHQACGETCAHLRRFYQRIDQLKHEKQRDNYRVQKTIIDKLPYLLKDDYKQN